MFVGSVLPPHLSPFVEEKEGDYVPPERLGQRQPDNDIEEEIPNGTSAIDLVENNAYLNSNVKRKRPDNEQPATTTTTKEDRVRFDKISVLITKILWLETSNAC